MTTASNRTAVTTPPSEGVPLLDLARQHGPLSDEIAKALAEVCRSGQFILGPEVVKLEEAVAAYCGVKHAIGCASGSDALLLALMACDVGPRDEVILPSFTFFATASAVTRLGATPIFADIDPVTFNLDPASVQDRISPDTKAILPVHLFGQCADMDALGQIAASVDIPLVEDAAQAIGAQWAGRRAGSIGAVGCLSFYPTKNLGGAGDGGMLTTNDEALAERLRLLRGHGMRPRYYHEVIGINSRLDSFQAAVLNVKMPHLDDYTQRRQTNADRYTKLFTEAKLDRHLGLPAAMPGVRHVWNQYVIRVPGGKRDALRAHLAEAKIGTEIYYPLGLHEQVCFAYLKYNPTDLPETHRASREVLALPIFPELTAEEQSRVVEQIARFFTQLEVRGELSGPQFLKRSTARSPRVS